MEHGYVDDAAVIKGANDAAFFINTIGRGFQNKLFTGLALGLPTIVHETMDPRIRDLTNTLAFICSSELDIFRAIDYVRTANFVELKQRRENTLKLIEEEYSFASIRNSIL